MVEIQVWNIQVIRIEVNLSKVLRVVRRIRNVEKVV